MPRIAHLKNQQAVWEESGWHIEVPDDIPDDEVEEWALEQPLDRLTLDYTQNGQEVGGIDSEWEVSEVIALSGGMATEAPDEPEPTDPGQPEREALVLARDALHRACLEIGSTEGYRADFDAINAALAGA